MFCKIIVNVVKDELLVEFQVLVVDIEKFL